MLATIRADLHNLSGRYEKRFEVADFMPGRQEEIEEKVDELVAPGWDRAAAAAAVTSRQTKEQQIHAIDEVKGKSIGRRPARVNQG